MFKKLLMVACLVYSGMAAKADESQRITSKVQKVVLFLNGAQVTRTAMVNVNAGTSELVFGEISPGIDVQSIQVHAGGEFTILSVKHELDFINEQAKQKHIEDLRDQQKIIRDKIALQSGMLSVYQEEASMLEKNQVISGQNASLDVIKLKQALDFQTERLIAIKEKQLGVTNQVAALNAELQKYDRQIADITRGSTTATSNILVTISSKTALQSVFMLSYLVHNASWYPTYDIRAKDINSPVNISYKANVSQHSGEDWKNIKLTLSTGNPSVSGNKPELNPYYLNYGMYYTDPSATAGKITGKVFATDDHATLPGVSVRVKGTTVGTVTDVNGNFSLQVPPNAKALTFSFIGYETVEQSVTGNALTVGMMPSARTLQEVNVVSVGYGSQKDDNGDDEPKRGNRRTDLTGAISTVSIGVINTENQTNVEFNIENPYSIPSDGKQYLVEINQVDVKASYQYFVAPKLNIDVFLTAQITDWNKYNFLSGEANLFFEGTYIGKSLIDTHNATDTLNLSLGTDKNIVVTRTLQKELTEKQTFGSNKKETRNWLIDVRNRKSQPVNLLIEDQVPVSQNSSIEVETQETTGVKPDVLTGKVSWNFLLNSQDDKKLQLKYQVKYPKNQSVIVQ